MARYALTFFEPLQLVLMVAKKAIFTLLES